MREYIELDDEAQRMIEELRIRVGAKDVVDVMICALFVLELVLDRRDSGASLIGPDEFRVLVAKLTGPRHR